MMEKKEAIEIAKNDTENRPLEEIFAELDEILAKMQDPEVTLEDSFALYESGMKDIRQCNRLLDQIEKKMLILSKEGELTAFDGEA